jgi:excisionase family DNA binding protein
LSLHFISKTMLTIPEAANVGGVTPMTRWRWVKSDHIESLETPGGQHRISRSALFDFIGDGSESAPAGGRRSAPRILVADDDARIQTYLSRLPIAHGYTVKTWSDGFEVGIGGVIQFQPQLLNLDLCMPDRDGFYEGQNDGTDHFVCR